MCTQPSTVSLGMDENPYSPPRSALTAVSVSKPPTGRPSQVALAVQALWLDFGVAWVFILLSIRTVLSSFLAFALTLVITAASALLIAKISQGRNWARIVFLVSALIYFAERFFVLVIPIQRDMIDLISTVFHVPLQMASLYFLFTEPGRRWFKR